MTLFLLRLHGSSVMLCFDRDLISRLGFSWFKSPPVFCGWVNSSFSVTIIVVSLYLCSRTVSSFGNQSRWPERFDLVGFSLSPPMFFGLCMLQGSLKSLSSNLSMERSILLHTVLTYSPVDETLVKIMKMKFPSWLSNQSFSVRSFEFDEPCSRSWPDVVANPMSDTTVSEDHSKQSMSLIPPYKFPCGWFWSSLPSRAMSNGDECFSYPCDLKAKFTAESTNLPVNRSLVFSRFGLANLATLFLRERNWNSFGLFEIETKRFMKAVNVIASGSTRVSIAVCIRMITRISLSSLFSRVVVSMGIKPAVYRNGPTILLTFVDVLGLEVVTDLVSTSDGGRNSITKSQWQVIISRASDLVVESRLTHLRLVSDPQSIILCDDHTITSYVVMLLMLFALILEEVHSLFVVFVMLLVDDE